MLLNFALIGFGQLVRERLLSGLVEALHESSVSEILELFGVDEFRLIVMKPKSLSYEEIAFIKSKLPENIILEGLDVAEKRSFEYLTELLKESRQNIVYIASPNYTHAGYIDFFLDKANRIFVEKPLCNNVKEIETLLSKHSEEELEKVRMVDHYLYKPPIYELIYNFQHYYEFTGKLEEFEAKILINKPYEESRQWLYLTGVIRDLFTHILSIIFKLHELYPKILPIEKIKVQSVKKALYDLDGLEYEVNYDESKLKETYANIKLKLGKISIKSEVGCGVNRLEKKITLKGEKGEILLDIDKNTIDSLENGQRNIYSCKSPRNEYKRLMKEILTGEKAIGLDFQFAKMEVEIFEMLDKFNAMKRYKIGSKPKSILGL